MKKILIISPHFPPSNLTAVHRARFFANHLAELGWEPIILTVHERYYEEELDWNLETLLPLGLRVVKVNAIKITKPRVIGDIGLRSFFSIYRKAKQLIKYEEIDFLYITIPSFYGALWGRWLNKSTGIKYGIDYIDPWVHEFPGSNRLFSRHRISTRMAKILEPIAVKKASLISGVAASYYQGVIERNPRLIKTCRFMAIPFGSEKSDHEAIKKMSLQPYLFQNKPGKLQMVYAGAMLPKAFAPLEEIFKAISKNKAEYQDLEFYFIGSGRAPNDANGYNIKPLAVRYGLWESVVFEFPKRIPYLDVLVHLNVANGVFILGSTEAHYTPSKIYQAVLSEKPILAVLHTQSTGVKVLKDTNLGRVIRFNGENDIHIIGELFPTVMKEYIEWIKMFDPLDSDSCVFEEYSALSITMKLVEVINELIRDKQVYDT